MTGEHGDEASRSEDGTERADVDGDDLAAVVPEARTEEAIGALRAEGVYDDARSVASYGDGRVAIPVTAAPAEAAVDAVVAATLPARSPGLDERLRERGFSAREVAAAPGSWAVVGDVVLADFTGCERAAAVGEALLDLHREADTVLDRRGVEGPHREPSVSVVAGSGDTETVHAEHGTRYALDLSAVMFSPGNKAERVRMGEAVAAGERVLDMFAGVGYFTLPMARAGAHVTAVERNPAAFRYLVENAPLNDVMDRVVPVRADCRDAVAARPDTFDRVVMGHYDAHEYLDSALDALETGGTVHLHATAPANDPYADPVEHLRAAARRNDRSLAVEDRRTVKSYGPGRSHVVVSATADR